MSTYTVRVELHNADDLYDDLHKAMAKEGFFRSIVIGDEKFQLPTAEYSLAQSDLSAQAILNKAERAANSVKPIPQPSILVTKTEIRRYHSGLKKI